MSLAGWSWLFLGAYVAGLLAFGWVASKRVHGGDDFATARKSYGPWLLALAFAASAASGGTFLGSPGLSYTYGFATLWGAALYPVGLYLGVLVSIRLVATCGNRFGNRTIPEFLGDRYRSDGVRLLVSLLSLVLCFYVAGQLVSGLVMFETMLGLDPAWALAITAGVLMVYVVLGGAHADILTDGVQGFLMLLVAVLTLGLVAVGFGVEGGFGGIVDSLRAQDPDLVGPLNRSTPLAHSWWSVVALLLAHVPLGMLPHVGNKVWALEDDRDRMRFVRLAFGVGLVLGLLGCGGVLARAVLGDALLAEGRSPNEALPALFVELLPPWLAALIGVGILAAVMSTADGLVIACSQIVANDVYRRTVVPRLRHRPGDAEVDRRVLLVSRWSTVGVLLLCVGLAWATRDMNVALLVSLGSGGLMASFAGPLVLGALWRGVTLSGAFAGLVSGMATFALLHSGLPWRLVDPAALGPLAPLATWLAGEATNPFSCAALGELVSVALTWAVSRVTRPLDARHVEQLFGAPGA